MKKKDTDLESFPQKQKPRKNNINNKTCNNNRELKCKRILSFGK